MENKGVAIRAVLEPEMCLSGPQKEAAKGSEGLIFISKEEYFQLYCLRELFIDSLLKWSKLESGKKSSDELHNLWDALFIGNYFPKRKEVNRLLNKLLKKECVFYIRHDIEQYFHDIILGFEFTIDEKARLWLNHVTNKVVNPALYHFKDSLSLFYEELLMKKWDMYKKVFNIGFRFNDWAPLQPNEWKFYIDVLDNLKPLNYFEAKINKIFKELRVMEKSRHICLQIDQTAQQVGISQIEFRKFSNSVHVHRILKFIKEEEQENERLNKLKTFIAIASLQKLSKDIGKEEVLMVREAEKCSLVTNGVPYFEFGGTKYTCSGALG
ncbi:hypothetical protein ABK040_008644 [Willaertia magna]